MNELDGCQRALPAICKSQRSLRDIRLTFLATSRSWVAAPATLQTPPLLYRPILTSCIHASVATVSIPIREHIFRRDANHAYFQYTRAHSSPRLASPCPALFSPGLGRRARVQHPARFDATFLAPLAYPLHRARQLSVLDHREAETFH